MSPCDALAPVPLDRRRLMGGQRRSRRLVPGIRDGWLRAAGARLRASPARERGGAGAQRLGPGGQRVGVGRQTLGVGRRRRRARRRSGRSRPAAAPGRRAPPPRAAARAPGGGAQAAASEGDARRAGRLGMLSFWASAGPAVSIRRAGWPQAGQGARGRRAMSEGKDAETLAEQGKHMAHNMAEVFDISGQIWQTFLAAPDAGGGVEASRSAEHLADLLRALPHDVGQPEAGRRQDHRVLGGAAAALAELDAEVARRQGGGAGPAAAAHAEGRQALQPQGVVGERDLRLPQAVLPADLGLDAGHGQLGRRDGPEGAPQGGLLHPLLRRGDEPGELLRAEPRGARGDGRTRRARTSSAA